MTTKKVQIGARPTSKADATLPTGDDWVATRSSGDVPERMKRLTIDVPESLHREIKAACAMRGTMIADEVRELLLQKYRKQ